MEVNDEFKPDMAKTDLLLGILKIESPSKFEASTNSKKSVAFSNSGSRDSLIDEGNFQEMPGESFDQKGSPSMHGMTEDYALRLNALEESDELRAIYSHPSWQEFARVLYNGKAAAAASTTSYEFDHQMRQWAESHPQIAPVIAWFHQCTSRFGLSFDPYVSVPQSRHIRYSPAETCTTAEGSEVDFDAQNAQGVNFECAPACPDGLNYDYVHMIPAEGAGECDPRQQQLHWQYLQQQQQQAFLQQQQAYHAHYFYQQAHPQYQHPDGSYYY